MEKLTEQIAQFIENKVQPEYRAIVVEFRNLIKEIAQDKPECFREE